MPAICDLARSHGLAVIEDCAQAHGAFINGQSVGSFGDVSAWSFCQDKIMTTAGEGGMVTTSNEELWIPFGLSKITVSLMSMLSDVITPGFRWLHNRFGSNFRLTELQSAIGRVQLRYLPNGLQSVSATHY